MPFQPTITAIVPARDEAAVIASCIESLAQQPEIAEILVVDDHSADQTAEIVRGLIAKIPHLRLIEAGDLPSGWVGKNNAVWTGARQAKSEWLLFTDADAVLLEGAAAKALEIARTSESVLVSFSPEQILVRWYEKALIPFVYCRLASKFSFGEVSDPKKNAAAANGQFLMIRRDIYESVDGHAGVAGDVLEDVALAHRVKDAGNRIWFGAGTGIVRVRMYRSFNAMWQGWRKNLFLLVGGYPSAALRELEAVIPWMAILVILMGIRIPLAMFLGVWLIIFRQISYGKDLTRNHYPFSFIIYYPVAVFLYALVLWRSSRAYASGRVFWKGREYPVGIPGTSK